MKIVNKAKNTVIYHYKWKRSITWTHAFDFTKFSRTQNHIFVFWKILMVFPSDYLHTLTLFVTPWITIVCVTLYVTRDAQLFAQCVFDQVSSSIRKQRPRSWSRAISSRLSMLSPCASLGDITQFYTWPNELYWNNNLSQFLGHEMHSPINSSFLHQTYPFFIFQQF